MSETRRVSLGGRTFDVPQLPLGLTMLVYPICQRLTNAGLAERLRNVGDDFAVTEDEMGDLTEIAFQAAHVVDDTLDSKAFLALPVTPVELFGAFFAMRIQCGGWHLTRGEGGDPPGEPPGASMPPTSTSDASSPNLSGISISQKTTG